MSTYADFPFRMNLQRIIIHQLSSTDTVQDNDFREPVGPKQRPDVLTLEGQVNMKMHHRPMDRTMTGDREGSTRSGKGKCVFKKAYLDNLGITFHKGDKVIEVGPAGSATSINGVIFEVVPVAPLRGQFTLVEAHFEYDHEKRESIA